LDRPLPVAAAPITAGPRAPWGWLSLALAAGAAVLLALGGGLLEREPPARLVAAPLAVLPFERIGPGNLPDWLGPAVAAALIDDLTGIADLPVTGYGSVDGFRSTRLDPLAAGRELGVTYVVHGQLRQMGGQEVAVTARLLETRRGTQLWSEQFARPRAQLADLQRELATKVAAAFGAQAAAAQLAAPSSGRAGRGLAHELVLEASVHLQRRTPEDVQRARQLFRTALAHDDGEPRAWLGLAQALVASHGLRWPPVRGQELAQAESALARAQAIAPQLLDVRGTAGAVLGLRGKWPLARALLEDELASHPGNAAGRHWLALALLHLGQHGAAAIEAERALALSPRDPGRGHVEHTRALALLHAGQLRRAVEAARQAAASPQPHPLAWATLAAALQLEGEVEAARGAMQQFLRSRPGASLALVKGRDGVLPPGKSGVLEAMVAAGLPRQ
jgi:adenylate cyclase